MITLKLQVNAKKRSSQGFEWLFSTINKESILPTLNGHYDITKDEYKKYLKHEDLIVDVHEDKKYTTYIVFKKRKAVIEHNPEVEPKQTKKQKVVKQKPTTKTTTTTTQMALF